MLYTLVIEAQGYGEPDDDAEALSRALPDDDADMTVGLGIDEARRLLRVELVFDANNALDAHEAGLEVWVQAWEEAFPDLGGTALLAVKATPGKDREAVAAGSADPLADLDDS